jgi:hypothetical protein
MSITIDKLVTCCRVPRRHEGLGRQAAQVAKHHLTTALTQFVGPALARQPRVVRLGRLKVKLTLAGSKISEISADALAAAWAQALARSLFEALAHPSGFDGFQILRAASAAEFRATFLRDLLAGRVAGRWEYTEFDDLIRLPITLAATTLLLDNPAEIAATLSALDGLDALDPLLSRLDNLALERLFAAIAGAGDMSTPSPLAVEDLLWTARQVLETPRPRGFVLDGRRQALWIFVRTNGAEGRSPRHIFHMLLALACLLECPELLGPSGARKDDWPASTEEIARLTGRQLPRTVGDALLKLRHRVDPVPSEATARTEVLVDRLREALDRLRPFLPTAAPIAVGSQSPWRAIDSAGLLLLVRIVQRLGWSDLRGDRSRSPWGEPRLFQILMAGIGAAALGRVLTTLDVLDPAVALFAGMEGEPDLARCRHSLASIDEAGRRRLLEWLVPDSAAKGLPQAAVNWAATIDALAARLIGEFTSLVRGFRQAPREAIVRQFLRTPARVQVAERWVSVVLESNPYHVALHLSGMDEPVPSVSWMGGRRLELRLLGL